ncbi:hypothetical protein M3Y94_00595000 [Aphelenchoides besseyi]|nr:hypothetical protein M3Y94_00595000 [Aphelenchoides besseyi]KAI6222164.1 hypothetical protein M3Y95_00955600 [Aphelenchoides besseyi]
MGVEFEEEVKSPETGRSRRQSPIELELKTVIQTERASTLGDDDLRNASFDIFDETDLPVFQPKLNAFGAPEFRCTTSVIALLALTTGMVLITSGACILVFFVDVEPTIFPLGITLGALGLLLFLIGSAMWCSEFMCNDCLGRTYVKLKEAPLKNAIERRSRMASRATLRTGSRASVISKVSQRTNETIVSLPPKF